MAATPVERFLPFYFPGPVLQQLSYLERALWTPCS